MGSSGLFIYPNDPNHQPPPGVLRALTLRRVLPIVQSFTVENGELTVVSLDLYDDGSILNYFIVGNEEMQRQQAEHNAEMQRLARLADREAMRRYVQANLPGRFGPNVYVRMEDDLGTAYAGLNRSANGSEIRWEANYGFTPVVPLEATCLRIMVFEGDWQRETGETTKRDPEQLVASIDVPL
jgi:hypothetical protein